MKASVCHAAAIKPRGPCEFRRFHLLVVGRMELGLSLGETMADAGRDLVLGLGMGVVRKEEDERRSKRGREEAAAAPVRLELEFGAAESRGRSSPEPPPVRLTLLSMVPGLGVPWPPSSDIGERCDGFVFFFLRSASRGR